MDRPSTNFKGFKVTEWHVVYWKSTAIDAVYSKSSSGARSSGVPT